VRKRRKRRDPEGKKYGSGGHDRDEAEPERMNKRNGTRRVTGVREKGENMSRLTSSQPLTIRFFQKTRISSRPKKSRSSRE
jgi:hypothetical protein